MFLIDLNEQFIVYAVFNGDGKWYVSYKDIWFLDYWKRVDAYREKGYEINLEYIDERRKGLLYIDSDNAAAFLKRLEPDEYSTRSLSRIFFEHKGSSDYLPSLYVDFDTKRLYSMYMEPASYEDYAPEDWDAKEKRFLELIPEADRYWTKSQEGVNE